MTRHQLFTINEENKPFPYQRKYITSQFKNIRYRVNKRGCFICLSHPRNNDGYPKIKRHGREWILSRYVWYLYNGNTLNNLLIRHSCDNPSCINIEHLSIGTDKDNAKDRVDRNRQHRPIGIKNGRAKLTARQVLDIINSPLSQKELSKKYDVNQVTISYIKIGKRWSNITNVVYGGQNEF